MTLNYTWESCLLNELRKLKESSKEAVEGLDGFSRFKQYMHVTRTVELELVELIRKAKESPIRQLILVCGGVGDGKSHLISYLKQKGFLEGFRLHNDATESFEPEMTSLETLDMVLDAFSDENIGQPGSEKLILAINLGALANFIDSSEQRYQELAEYVKRKHILDSAFESNEFDPASSIQFINFSDYHMYTLTSEGAKSEYISTILEKIVSGSEENPFHQAYVENCTQACPFQDKCPVKSNYEFLGKEHVRRHISDVLIEAMIKYKMLISTRALLNFVFYILVPNDLDQLSVGDLEIKLSTISLEEYLRYILPTLLYDHSGVTYIHETLKKLDPINRRVEKIDELYIALHTRDDIAQLFIDNVETESFLMFHDTLTTAGIKSADEKLLEQLSAIFLRFYRLDPNSDFIDLRDSLFDEYVENLYWWNSQSKPKLKNLYDTVKGAIYAWGGATGKDFLSVTLGKSQTKFRIYEQLPLISDAKANNGVETHEIERFLPSMELTFREPTSQLKVTLAVDFPLYKLLMDVRGGYRPNRSDRNNFINFVRFIEEISQQGNKSRELVFEDRLSDMKRRYRLTFDEGFEEYSFGEITT